MKLYRHYKNKPYKYLGMAKHSETLEDVVVYECLYPNELAKLWVRPRSIFESTVDGKPRFEKIEARIEIVTQFAETEIELVRSINEQIYPDWDQRYFLESFESRHSHMLVLAVIDNIAAGYKLGYPKDEHNFYSWLGGVIPKYRSIGLAEDLMNAQHAWARQNGFKKITTRTMNRFKPMLALNLKCGFDIVAAELDPKDNRFKISLEKTL